MTAAPPETDKRALLQTAAAHLRENRPAQARALLEELTAHTNADPGIWYGLALACQALQDAPAAHAAADRALALEPRNPRALVLKADLLTAAGDVRAASAHYAAALKAAPPAPPPDLARDLQRAHDMRERFASHFHQHLRDALAQRGQDPALSARFSQSLEILAGRRRVYPQEPHVFYLPGLPVIEFFDRADFPWLDGVEAATSDIRSELMNVLADANAFAPYVEAEANRPGNEHHGMLNNPSWSAFYLWKNGEPVEENIARCPKTMAALAGAPLCGVPGRTPSILFSLMRPGAHIPPHTGMINTRLICHLPLIVPDGCTFRVGGETRTWREGKAWVFDDTINHEAWNRSSETRVILLFDIWRPELTQTERNLLSSMFQAIDAYGAGGKAWDV